MVSQNDDEDWMIDHLTTEHNGDNDAEVERVQQAHPGEPECVLDRRVLGALAPFRCMLDLTYKMDIFDTNIFRPRRYSLQTTP